MTNLLTDVNTHTSPLILTSIFGIFNNISTISLSLNEARIKEVFPSYFKRNKKQY